ncbi:MAG: hypothetical protein OES99_07840, partial [Gammaproteobacteria bacterium]|nr:hypothetical protein [Gammaproteobacteria bacterium]
MKNSIAVVITACVMVACAHSGVEDNARQFAGNVVVESGRHKELCFESNQGDKVIYRFEANSPLKFNLHYHQDEEVFFPVPEHATAAEKGQYIVVADDTYCLMWTNSHDT